MEELKILILGNGYLGSYLAEELRSKGHHVEVASKNGKGTCREADLGDVESIQKLSGELKAAGFTPDFITHCASSSRGGPEAYRSVFVDGIQHLVSVFSGIPLILTSSTSVYPQVDGGTVNEDSPTNPDRETGKYLRTAEEQLLAAGGIVLRLAGIYGPGRSVHLKKLLEGSAKIEKGEVSRWLNQIHRDDAAQAIIHFIESGDPGLRGEIYNVADDEPISQRECYERLARILNLPVPGETLPDKNRKRAWTHKRVSNDKIKATGWRLRFPSFTAAVTDDPRLLESLK
ncbi:MAG: SDR family oxidoreductase [Verrucomicrobiales bacterium]|nr:SDR family oxidoreductase [Verrucomicrobiales bacterium]